MRPVLTVVGRCGSYASMKSQLAIEARQALAADVRRMTPEERLAAYVRHCQLLAEVRRAGETRPRVNAPKPAADAH